MKFAALDLECATSDSGNICEVGLVVFEDGKEVDRFRSLVRPVIDEFGDWQRWNFDYGLKDTLKAPTFPAVWSEVNARIAGLPVVAHNASVVECKHLGHAFSFHGLSPEDAPDFFCTLELARAVWPEFPKHGIKSIARHFEWKLDHHNPESDARVCASIVSRALVEKGCTTWDELVKHIRWNRHRVPAYKIKLRIAPKPPGPRTREDYLHELVSWEPTAPLVEIHPGQSFVLSGFDTGKKAKLRRIGNQLGLLNKRSIKGGIDFLVADERMGAGKYAKCVEHNIPIVSEQEFGQLIETLASKHPK